MQSRALPHNAPAPRPLPVGRLRPASWLVVMSLVLAGCGGGGSDPTEVRQANPSVAGTAATPLDADALFNWAERRYPELFPGSAGNQTFETYLYRFHPASRNHVGVSGDSVYILGPVSGDQLQRVGKIEDFRCQVLPDSCPFPAYSRAGWSTRLSTLQHGVSGQATIIDQRTIRLTGFNYDGGGPRVYAYLASSDDSAAYNAGRTIGQQLNRPGQPYLNASIDLQLPEGQTLDGSSAISIWCADFKVNFGSGTFRPPG